MALLIAVLATTVAALGIILFAVHKTRPRSLRLTASVTRWLSVSLEIESPQRVGPSGATRERRTRAPTEEAREDEIPPTRRRFTGLAPNPEDGPRASPRGRRPTG